MITIDEFDIIKLWDDQYVENHVYNTSRTIADIYKNMNVRELHYLDIGFNVGKVYDIMSRWFDVTCYGFEPSSKLFEYVSQKYRENSKVHLYNKAVSLVEGDVVFNTTNMDDQLKLKNPSYLNLGGSKIQYNHYNTHVPSIKISEFLKHNLSIAKSINFIKIDTETKDADVLEDLLTVLDLLPNLKVIETEINYYTGYDYSYHEYMDLLDKWLKHDFICYSQFTHRNLVDQEARGDIFLMKQSVEPNYEFFKKKD